MQHSFHRLTSLISKDSSDYTMLVVTENVLLVGVDVGVKFHAPPDYLSMLLSSAVFTSDHLTDTDKQNSTGKYAN